jgi:hypothetical protein
MSDNHYVSIDSRMVTVENIAAFVFLLVLRIDYIFVRSQNTKLVASVTIAEYSIVVVVVVESLPSSTHARWFSNISLVW